MNTKPENPDESHDAPQNHLLMNVNEVAQFLSISIRLTWQLSASGDIPKPIRLGRQIIRWRRTDLEQYIQDLPAE